MPEQEIIFRPTTQAVRDLESVTSLPRIRLVSVGLAPDKKHTPVVQLGSSREVLHAAQLEMLRLRRDEREITTTVLFDKTMVPDERLMDDTSLEHLQHLISGTLFEGEFTVVTEPGLPSRVVPEKRGIWTPMTDVFRDRWKLEE